MVLRLSPILPTIYSENRMDVSSIRIETTACVLVGENVLWKKVRVHLSVKAPCFLSLDGVYAQ